MHVSLPMILATSKRGAELATTEYMVVGKDFGLSLSIPKTKVMAVGKKVMTEDRIPLKVGGEETEAVSEFPYLGSQIESFGRMTLDVDKRIAQASKAFGALRNPVFLDGDLNINTKRTAYCLCSYTGQSAGHH